MRASTPPSAGKKLAAVAMFLPLVTVILSALVLTAAMAYALVIRGWQQREPGWIGIGLVLGALWLLMLVGTIRKRVKTTRFEAASRS